MNVKKSTDYDRFRSTVLKLEWGSVFDPCKLKKVHPISWSERPTCINSPAGSPELDSDTDDELLAVDPHEHVEDVPTYPQLELCAFAKSCWMLGTNNNLPFTSIYNAYQKERRVQTEMKAGVVEPKIVTAEENKQLAVLYYWFPKVWKSLYSDPV